MEFITLFLKSFLNYCIEIGPSIMLGFFISGLFNEFIPQNLVNKHLGEKGIKAILMSSLVGVILPVCCFGALPLAVTLRRKGANLGPVLAFLVTTPTTSVSAMIVCWRILGLVFTGYIFCAVIIMGLIMGFVGNSLQAEESPGQETKGKCCHEDKEERKGKNSLLMRFRRVFHYAFIKLPKEIGLELLLGIVVASFVVIYDPFQRFIQWYFSGLIGYLMFIIIGLLTYVCSTASVPLADAIIRSGLSSGQAMTFLLVGPITSYGTIFVLKKEFGVRVLTIYLLTISALSLIFGMSFTVFF